MGPSRSIRQAAESGLSNRVSMVRAQCWARRPDGLGVEAENYGRTILSPAGKQDEKKWE